MFYFAIFTLFCIHAMATKDTVDNVPYISLERPRLIYLNPKFMSFFNMTSRRYGRRDPIHYLNINWKNIVPIDNSYLYSLYFLELLTNQYKRSFVEFHLKGCDFAKKDSVSSLVLNNLNDLPCPLPPGEYSLQNLTGFKCGPAATFVKKMTVHFPFSNGRIHINVTHIPTGENMAIVTLDIEKKHIKVKSTANC